MIISAYENKLLFLTLTNDFREKNAENILFKSLSCKGNQLLFGPCRKKTCLRRFGNNTGADQPAHPCSPIRASVIRFLESIICKFASGEI